MRRPLLTTTLLLAAMLAPAGSAFGQLPIEDWTDRPDARAPAGLTDDVLLPPGEIEVVFSSEYSSYEGLLFEADEVPEVLLFPDFSMAPLSMTIQRFEIEGRYGILDWLGASVKLPIQYASAELATDTGLSEKPNTFGLGDIEARVLYTIHNFWPYRAHLIGGISFPTGPVSIEGPTPVNVGDVTLPYPLQPGDGTFALLPGIVLVAENGSGTVGLRADARLPFGENNRDWRRGSQFSADIWMAYRFSDWLSGSLRVTGTQTASITGADTAVDPLGSPLGDPTLQGGTRIILPIGINIMFPRGPYWANRLGAEFVIPLHQNLNGPQISQNYGAVISWDLEF